jgi:hypothetical protein
VENASLGMPDRLFLDNNPLTSATFEEDVQQLIARGVYVGW